MTVGRLLQGGPFWIIWDFFEKHNENRANTIYEVGDNDDGENVHVSLHNVHAGNVS